MWNTFFLNHCFRYTYITIYNSFNQNFVVLCYNSSPGTIYRFIWDSAKRTVHDIYVCGGFAVKRFPDDNLQSVNVYRGTVLRFDCTIIQNIIWFWQISTYIFKLYHTHRYTLTQAFAAAILSIATNFPRLSGKHAKLCARFLFHVWARCTI